MVRTRITILPATGDRPIRPDLPWLRNLSWKKVHAMQLGFALGLIIYWSYRLSMMGVAFGLTVLVAEVLVGKGQKFSRYTACEHDIGFHDVIAKPWYFTTFATLTFLILLIWF